MDKQLFLLTNLTATVKYSYGNYSSALFWFNVRFPTFLLCLFYAHVFLCVLTGGIYILCPFAVYYLRYAVRSFFTLSRISLGDGKRAGQKIQRKIAAPVQKVKSPVLFIPLFWNQRNKFSTIILFVLVIKLTKEKTEGLEREGLERER